MFSPRNQLKQEAEFHGLLHPKVLENILTHPPMITAIIASVGAPSFRMKALIKVGAINTGKNHIIHSE